MAAPTAGQDTPACGNWAWAVAVGLAVGDLVEVGEEVACEIWVADGEEVALGVDVGLLVGPAVAEAVGEGLLVGEGDGLAVGLAVGDGEMEAWAKVKVRGAQDFVSAANPFLGAVGATAWRRSS